ncbi:AbrB family transcriptional regulator [Roseomonas marmotae]|uniref:AbrB family transcriptional regulator n=1 Tax=Roseomonas marmotae TaxID=2768161 RepID=A0ABS3KA30_9PROT|nr:AbrB family transcriptional regulator [Roseomonas marmotae]MBO1073206.1 AbrB family transcriptional regulator [Roseomonas marmotae]QTI79164.1 AbrB family transcriptional regulator [Roseomonas marmotae]
MKSRIPPHSATPPDLLRKGRDYLFCYLLGGLGGGLFFWLHSPLPWLLGALVFVATARLAGAPVMASRPLRNGAMLLLGCALGLFFTPHASEHIARHGLLVLGAALVTLAIGIALAPLLARLARLDRASALFGSIPGGVAEMSLLGESYGARPSAVAVVQLLRVVGVVVMVPTSFMLLGVQGQFAGALAAVTQGFSPGGFVLLMGAGALAALVLGRIGVRNFWLLGGLLVSAGLTMTGYNLSGVPMALTAAGQIALGAHLGVQFERATFLGGGRMLSGALVHVALLTGICAVLGVALGLGFGLDPATMVLATAPGGVAEMSLTAKILLLEVPVVVAFHLVRIFMVAVLVQPVSIVLRRRGML